jgi:hypothetical protein
VRRVMDPVSYGNTINFERYVKQILPADEKSSFCDIPPVSLSLQLVR